MRLSIFTSSLNYENFVSAQNLSLKVRAFPLLGQRWSSGNTAEYFWFYSVTVNADPAFALYMYYI